ncbi:MAG TPA: neutral/alkaline non-lysosomal ceramidase N-terminal domain-containing protein, partial [Spirochaetia bacterium]|nr:neutral/alkaline non-lysosomal ceramidase N-terminal domain-containing protein [Spirochaetia bacterium]
TDVVGVPIEIVQKIRDLASDRTGIPADHIMISATHTHSGPELRGEGEKTASPSYIRNLIDSIAGGITSAWKFRRPARIGFNDGAIQGIGVNRRNPKGGAIDAQVGVLRVDYEDTGLGCVFFNYTCHPVVLGPDNLLISADYPGYAMRLIERIKGEEVAAMFSNGASGDINTGHSADLSALGYPIPGRTFERAEKLGTMLAGEVLKVLETVETVPDLTVRAASKIVPLSLKPLPPLSQLRVMAEEKQKLLESLSREKRTPEEKLLKAKVEAFYAELLISRAQEREEIPRGEKSQGEQPQGGQPKGRQLDVELQAFLIGKTALVAFPGEMFVEIGLSIKGNSPFKKTLIMGLTNGSVGYLPAIKAFEEGGYETTSARFVKESAKIIEHSAVDLLKSLA